MYKHIKKARVGNVALLGCILTIDPVNTGGWLTSLYWIIRDVASGDRYNLLRKKVVCMIYICPVCGKEYDNEESVAKCFLQCWKDNNPHHRSKPAPRSDNVIMSEVDKDILQFFNSLQKEQPNARNDG